ncbi:hypothetical protein AN958_04212, partial [Leucoagaricus sp. SymC.cos]
VTENSPRPLWPGVIPSTRSGWLREQLEVDDRLGTMTHCGTDTIVTGITAANDDDILALSADVGVILELGTQILTIREDSGKIVTLPYVLA